MLKTSDSLPSLGKLYLYVSLEKKVAKQFW